MVGAGDPAADEIADGGRAFFQVGDSVDVRRLPAAAPDPREIGTVADSLHQYFLDGANQRLVHGVGNVRLFAHDRVVSSILFFFRDPRRKIRGGRAFFPRIGENAQVVKSRFCHEIEQPLKPLLRFSRKPHDERGAKRKVGHQASRLTKYFPNHLR